MSDIPLWAALVVSALMIAGAAFSLIGCYGMLRFSSFYPRVHAPTLGTSLGMVGIMLASIVYFSVTQTRPLIHEVLIIVFMTLTTPVTLMLLARAALYRDRAERKDGIPFMRPLPSGEAAKIAGEPQKTEIVRR